ncbi:hypothetical protein V9T40_009686 [Parthenolecanium corni]|uniref:Reactive oxygen species modulator 1 n=1 Tax=Parthenolecanium corni TaxID=536013 RepID=A0AAN9TSZ5_9HEMI
MQVPTAKRTRTPTADVAAERRADFLNHQFEPAVNMNRSDHAAIRTPGCTDRVKAAFTIGAVVGITIGGLYGGSHAFRYGLEKREFFRVVGKQMLNMGFTFGVFMGVGTFIRC